MPQLTLYSAKGSCAFVPHAILLHHNIPFRLVPMAFGPQGVHAADGTISHKEYLKIHPMGYVPALAVDEAIITEVPALLSYISSLEPQAKLFGHDSLSHARVMEWLSYLSGSVHGRGFGLLFRPGRYSDDEKDFDKLRVKGKEFVGSCFGLIDSRLKGKTFAVGDELTAVDFYLYIFARWGKEVGFVMESEFPEYAAHAVRMEGVEGVRKAIEEQGLRFNFIQSETVGAL